MYGGLSKKPLLFKSFTALTVKEFDDIYDKEITKNMTNMRYSGYPKGRIKENDPLVLEDTLS